MNILRVDSTPSRVSTAAIGFTVVLGITGNFDLGADLLWLLLVVVWALTIPHMALTSRLDAKAMGFTKKNSEANKS